MPPSCANHRHENTHLTLKLGRVILLGLLTTTSAAAQEIHLGVTYLCNGEHIYIDSCNIRDTANTATCMVEHPDHVGPSGLAAISSMIRGALEQLLPTCQQPSAKQIAASDAFHKKQQDLYGANVQKANQQMAAVTQPAMPGQPAPPKNAEERAMRRCVSSGRLPATCTGNSLLGSFGQMIGQFLPSVAKEPAPGPDIAGVFQGAGNWRLDFINGGVLVNCSSLSPNQQNYTIDFRTNRAVITIETTPRPLVLTLRGNETIVGPPGPVVIDGVIATGSTRSGPDPNASSGYTDKYGMFLSNSQAASNPEIYTNGGQRYYGSVNVGGPTQATFVSRRVTCPALNLSSKGSGVGVQTMQTDLLKSMFSNGDKGPPTPTGIRMHGIFAASSGFSAQFFPESVILGCGPDAARAYPYTVTADGTKALIQIDAPDRPLTLAFRPDRSLDPASTGPYQIHGRIVIGQNDNGDFTFAPMERTCDLATLIPSKEIPSNGGANTMPASARNPAAAPNNGGGTLSTPAAPLGNATLAIVSGLPTQTGTLNSLAGHPYVLLRESYANALAKGGVAVPPGMSPYRFVANACAPTRTPDCQKSLDAVKAVAISAVRADVNGKGTLPGVPPGTYYLMISTRYNNQALAWDQAIQLNPGANTVTIDQRNATPIN